MVTTLAHYGEELETQLLLAKVFLNEGDTMHHTLVRKQYPDQVAAAERMTLDEALDQFLQVSLPQAIYANPPILAKDLKLPTATLYTALERLSPFSSQRVNHSRSSH